MEHVRGHIRGLDELEPFAETWRRLPHAHQKRVPIHLVVRITLIVVDQDLGDVVRVVVPPLPHNVSHRLDPCRDSGRELVWQQVATEVFISVASKALLIVRRIVSPEHGGGHRPNRLSLS